MADPRVRQIKIKTGVVKRLVKEKVMYEKEAKQQEEKIEKMKAEDGENYAIKKQIYRKLQLVFREVTHTPHYSSYNVSIFYNYNYNIRTMKLTLHLAITYMRDV
ncbi:tubulin-specific chaperone A [Leptonychotes weddellii]|uniref:Tubulin-specific chaperone A n=1 Tax=Leptonychotes weddellii TaxID=9713 RepID=A0A2U3YK33_LEPWE|nr:tubulin-specific chaperone A [Leptonychotes weddellii]